MHFFRMVDAAPLPAFDLLRLSRIGTASQTGHDRAAGGFKDRSNAANPGGMSAGQPHAFRHPAVRPVAHAAILGAVNHVDAEAARAAGVLAGGPSISVKIAREVDERVLHLDAFHVADSAGWDVHVAAAMDPVAGRRRA